MKKVFTNMLMARRILISAAFVVSLVASGASVSAASVAKAGYSGKILSQSATSVTLNPGAVYVFSVSIKNTGTVTWKNTGSRFVSAYTYSPKYRVSAFADASWYRNNQPAKIKETSVAPGKTATVVFKITAPAKAGVYDENFWLAAENYSWIDGAQFKITITVDDGKPPAAPVSVIVPPPPASVPVTSAQGGSASGGNNSQLTTPAVPSATPYAAIMTAKSYKDEGVVVAGGQKVSVLVAFKNIGTVSWQTQILRVSGLNATTAVTLAGDDWANASEPSRVREAVPPGSVGEFSFNILGPVSKGTYNLPLKLIVDGNEVPGSAFNIPIAVTEDAPELPTQEIPIPVSSSANEPNIRVGLWNVPSSVVLLNSSSFTVIGSNGATLASVAAQTTITVGFNRETKTVVVSTPNGQYSSPVPVRFVPSDPAGLFQVPNFGGWDATLYVNQFRGTMEFNYYAPSDNIWLIEELPLEEYVQGLAETSNDSSHEFQKALVVAARTYAYFVHSIGGKYALFDVQPSAADQVYRAYGSETIRPNLVKAAQETAGQMVTFGADVVVTPYFSRSDGRTRSWQEVWCCQVKPWLVSVPAPHDVGLTLWGHGVGMSANDALGWAVDGKTYDWILKYFYTGTALKKIY
jgi:Stage II sporulation protein/Ig-like domain from next to BRCA1 gene